MSMAGFIGGAADIVGGIIGADIANNHNTAMQNRQLKWEREKFNKEIELANSAHQREIADLKAAGINPVLTATGGQGAATPQGGSIGALQDSSGQILSNSINNATSALAQHREVQIKKEMAQAQANLMEKQGAEASASAIRHLSESGALDAKAKESAANALMYEQKTENLRKEAQILQNQIDNKELYKQQLIQEINRIKEDIKTAPTERAKNKAQTDLTNAETELTKTKKDLYKLAHIAGVVASVATGTAGIIGAAANSGRIISGISSALKAGKIGFKLFK